MLKSYVCFDLETTGLDPLYNEIIEIGALKVRDGKVAERFMEFIHPQEEISPMITNLTGITNEMVAYARPADAVISDFKVRWAILNVSIPNFSKVSPKLEAPDFMKL